jgi:uncharacterized membrane protein
MTTSDTSPPDQEPADPDTFIAHHPPERRATIERLRLLCVAALVGLISLGVAWELWLAPLPQGTGMLALKVLPLCLGVAGLLKHRLYTYRWLTLLIWLYFTEGVVRVTGDAGLSQILAGIEVVLSVVLFTACSVYIRLRLRVLPPKPKKGAAA